MTDGYLSTLSILKNILENLIESDDRGIELLLIEDLQSGFKVLLQFCLIHRDLVLLNKVGLSRVVWLSEGKFLAATSSISFSHN
jgi:hypothetical protein